jgi:hypothetical protein
MKKKLRSIIEYTCYGIMSAFYLFGCQKDENVKTTAVKPERILFDTRSAVVNLFQDTVYILQGQFERKANEELNIEEGTLIKVIADDFNTLGGISIAPGGIIRANGTRNKPIVFTSNTYTGNQKQNWNGISITGKAKNNSRGDVGDIADYSGALSFVRIEFAPLILDAVGNKTSLENVMVSYCNTSGQIEAKSSFNFYGGSVNAKNLISYACGGPVDFYLTNGYNGNMQNILAYRNPFFGNTGTAPYDALAGVFVQNSDIGETGASPNTFPVISNLTVLGPNAINGSASLYGDVNNTTVRSASFVVNSNAFFQIRNSLLLSFPRGGIYVNDGMSAENIHFHRAEIAYSVLHANDSSRIFFLQTDVYPPYNSYNLQNFVLEPELKNRKTFATAEYVYKDPFNYENPDLAPVNNSLILTGADFNNANYSNDFFTKVNYIGAIGPDNWLQGWTNFIPLRTNYNFPQ